MSNSEEQSSLRTVSVAPSDVAAREPHITEMWKAIKQGEILLHAERCQRRESESNGEVRQCTLPLCQKMKRVLSHMTTCEAGKLCDFPHCASSRWLKYHWENCTLNCSVCNLGKPPSAWRQQQAAAAVQTNQSSEDPAPGDIQRAYGALGLPFNDGIKRLPLYFEGRSGTAVDAITKELLEQEANENATVRNEKHEEINTSWIDESDVPPANETAMMGIGSIIEKNSENVKHAHQCADSRCLHPKCTEIKTYLLHKKSCGFCTSCQFYKNVVHFHICHCQDVKCVIEDCNKVKCRRRTSLVAIMKDLLPASKLPPSFPACILMPASEQWLKKAPIFLEQKYAEEVDITCNLIGNDKCAETCVAADEIEQLRKESETLKRELEVLKKENEELRSFKNRKLTL